MTLNHDTTLTVLDSVSNRADPSPSAETTLLVNEARATLQATIRGLLPTPRHYAVLEALYGLRPDVPPCSQRETAHLLRCRVQAVYDLEQAALHILRQQPAVALQLRQFLSAALPTARTVGVLHDPHPEEEEKEHL